MSEIIPSFVRDRHHRHEAQRAESEALTLEAEKAKDRGRGIEAEIQRYYADIERQIQELRDDRAGVERAPWTKEDTCKIAKDLLEKGRKQWLIDQVLRPHLEKCQGSAAYPFARDDMKVRYGGESEIWRVLFSVFTDADIEAVCRELPDIGMTVEEKAKKVAAIDQQIKQLMEKLKAPPPLEILGPYSKS